MTLNDMDTIDRAAMLLGTGLMFLGIVVLGLVETLDGEPFGAAPLTNDAGDVLAQPTIDPAIRTGLVIAGLVVLGLWGVYKMWRPATDAEPATPADTTAD
jgi:hypothetical protein